jgi:hypothetical protein
MKNITLKYMILGLLATALLLTVFNHVLVQNKVERIQADTVKMMTAVSIFH